MLLLRQARVPTALLDGISPAHIDPLEPSRLCDIRIESGRLAEVGIATTAPAPAGATVIEAGGALVFPGLIDAHVHLDKTHTWYRAPNRTGGFFDALATLARDRVNWTADDIRRRADFALRCAWAHGTRAIRTHVDTGLPWAETSHAVLGELRTEWRGRIELQTVPLCAGDSYGGPEGRKLADLAERHGVVALGGFFQMSPDLPRQLDALLALARERGLGIDLHVDENGNPAAEVLRATAEAVLRNRFPLPVVCGHCCSLAVQAPERQRDTIDLVKAAGLSVVSLPMCNLYLQDRQGTGATSRTPHWRGITLLHELHDAGVPLAVASDNVRDAFFAYGDYDLIEVYTQSVRIGHLDARLADSVRLVTSAAADLIGRPELGRLDSGGPAHLIVTTARSFSELLSRPGKLRCRIDGETVSTPAMPDYVELNEPGSLT
jgi:cytosine deaminase